MQLCPPSLFNLCVKDAKANGSMETWKSKPAYLWEPSMLPPRSVSLESTNIVALPEPSELPAPHHRPT